MYTITKYKIIIIKISHYYLICFSLQFPKVWLILYVQIFSYFTQCPLHSDRRRMSEDLQNIEVLLVLILCFNLCDSFHHFHMLARLSKIYCVQSLNSNCRKLVNQNIVLPFHMSLLLFVWQRNSSCIVRFTRKYALFYFYKSLLFSNKNKVIISMKTVNTSTLTLPFVFFFIFIIFGS